MTATITTALTTALRATWKQLRQAAAGDDFAALLSQVYGAGAADAEAMRQRILSGSELGLCFDVLYANEMNGSLGGYQAGDTPGTATMDVNAVLLTDTAQAGTLRRMLLEAIGHHLHILLSGDPHSEGDEGQRFASLLRAAGEQPDAESQRDLRAFAALVPRDPALKEELRSCPHPDAILQLAYRKGFVLCSTELREESSNLAAPHWPWSGKGSIQRHRFFAAAA